LFDQIRELLSIPEHELGVATQVGAEVLTADDLVFTGPTGPPMTLGNMRELGVHPRSLDSLLPVIATS
jgi:hypothetical protein